MIIYLFLGGYISNFKIAKNKRIIIYILGIISALIMVWSVQTYIGVIPSIRAYVCSGADITNTLYCIAVFVFVLAICKDKENNHPKIKELSTLALSKTYVILIFTSCTTQKLSIDL